MQEEVKNTTQQEDTISLKYLILKSREWWRYFLSKWIVILIVGIAGAGLGLTLGFMEKPRYLGELTFVLEDSQSSPFAAYAGIASQFGIDLGMGSSSGIFQGDNILKLLKSRLLVEKTLLSSVRVNNADVTLAELYIKVNKIDEGWSEDPRLKDVRFAAGAPREKFTLLQDSILNVLYTKITKNDLEVEKPDKKLSFISVKCSTLSEHFSKTFVERLVKEAIDFYVNTKIKRSKVNVDKLQSAADSLEVLLNRKTYSVAVTKDINLNPARQVASVGAEVQSRDKMVLQTMYAEVIKNLELSKMAMAQETPLVQVVDAPILPLNKKKFGKLKSLILGGFLAGFLILCILIWKKLYRDAMSEA